MPTLDEHELHVWCVSVGDRESAPVLASLDADERAAMRRYRHPADALRFATGRAAVRILLGRYLGRAAREIVFDRTCRHCGASHGKPRVTNDRCLDFNLSGSGELVVIGVARGIVVGVDVETARDPREVAPLVLAPTERAPDVVLRWCCKEAVLKATGHGLAVDPRNVVIVDEDATFRVSEAPAHAELLGFAGVHLALPPGYRGAIATRPTPRQVRRFDVTPTQLLRC